MSKKYLGDSVYVEAGDGIIILTTENGEDKPNNTIILDPEVFHALVKYVEYVEKEIR